MRLIAPYICFACALIITAVSVADYHKTEGNGSDKAIYQLESSMPEKVRKRRVAAGAPVNIGDFPYMVSVRWYRNHHCGGSLYAREWVLTSARCLHFDDSENMYQINAEELGAWAGATDVRGTDLPAHAQEREVAYTVMHPYFTNMTTILDIGLMRLSEPFYLDNWVQLMTMPLIPDVSYPPEEMTNCHVTGWGYIKQKAPEESYEYFVTESLMVAGVVTISNRECESIVRDEVSECMICTSIDKSKGGDACSEDTGGPLVCDGIQVGIISLGVGCGWKGTATGYARMDCLLDWMRLVKAAGKSPEDGRIVTKEFGTTGWKVLMGVIGFLFFLVAVVLACLIYQATYLLESD